MAVQIEQVEDIIDELVARLVAQGVLQRLKAGEAAGELHDDLAVEDRRINVEPSEGAERSARSGRPVEMVARVELRPCHRPRARRAGSRRT